ncbi:polysaccharide biosynthesis protein [Alicyclobacillus fodiniaquatilis]|jgi:FlaA1/EpsC-like NDP-sugar epimerase|uniref:Polysaccharide biosynthesis protein n=1 Tax=Alicyclobacillus fodiniaquatilis TaxID=1661150 RepID=A0ABW4JJZ7_9BACL
MFEQQTCLITGGTGSWGHELTRKLLNLSQPPKEIRIFSRNEYAQVQMQRAFPADAPLSFVIGDVRDGNALMEACKGVDYVFHLAALKHVPICEKQPLEALKTNVTGTKNVIQASIANKVKKVIDVSTDKAVDPINFYGMTKAIGEKLILHANHDSEFTKFVCIRGGNVLGTNGSVVPLFKQQIQTTGRLQLTDRRMTRFFLTVSEAIDLLLTAAEVALGGETFVMKMKSCKIEDLANVMAKQLSQKRVPITEIGVRPGEKLHEVLVSRQEALHTYVYSDQYYVILPTHGFEDLQEVYRHYQPATFVEYDSNAGLLKKPAIEAMLRTGGFLS